ncbi:hypothetical protein LJC51_03160 [Lachnospiraceae bacterium OttesenSCG-928-J05]|nr:hypothetical protein [Lachnospiraceae bacterium OttesenSCG-928-J05]MDL2276323.1 hypothetical protein [Breznakia sp. OttesenSCG-928-G09]
MEKKLNFETFFEAYGAEFSEYLSRVSAETHSDNRYKELSKQLHLLYEQHPRITEVVDGNTPHSLSEEECTALLDVLTIRNRVVALEMEQVYFKGCADCAGYLKRMKLL